MIRFLARMVAFLALQVGVLCYFASGWRNEDHFLRSTLLKHELVKTTPSPRIIVAGGSSVIFGFRSELVEQGLGLPVINLGLHAGFFRDYILNEAEAAVRPGDILVVLLEYHAYCSYAPSMDLLKVAYFRPANLRYFSPRDWAWCADHGLEFLTNLVNAGWNDRFREPLPVVMPYCLASINRHGDCDTKLPPRFRIAPGHGLPGYYLERDKAVDRLLQLDAACRERGARMFLGYPPHCQEVTTAGLPALQDLDRYLRSRLDCPILWRPEESFYPAARMLDTNYHLADEAARDHTRLLIARLKPYLIPSRPYTPRDVEDLARTPSATK